MRNMEDSYCCSCGKRFSKGEPFISFEHKGLRFSNVPRDHFRCPKCQQDEIIALFNRSSDIINVQDGQIKINWASYILVARQLLRFEVRKILLYIGVLSREREGNWYVVSCTEAILNPDLEGSALYFTTREQIINYARIMLGKIDGWEIHGPEKEIITKEKVFEYQSQ